MKSSSRTFKTENGEHSSPAEHPSLAEHPSPAAGARRRKAAPCASGAAWLPALEILAAFHGAVFGIIGAVAGELTSDKMLVLIASIGAMLCTTVWVRRLDDGM